MSTKSDVRLARELKKRNNRRRCDRNWQADRMRELFNKRAAHNDDK